MFSKVSTILLAAALCCTGVSPALGASASQDVVENGSIAFGRYDPVIGDFSLWVAESDGSGQRRVSEGPSSFSDWSPDGTRLAFDSPDDTGVHIATIAPDGSDRRPLTSAVGVQEVPKWSPDGEWITYNAFSFDQEPFAISIWIMRSDGTDARQLTRDAVDVEPVFSPDGSQIAFGRIVGGSPEGQLEAIYVMNSDGSGAHEVVPARPGLEHPDWSPDGRSIIFNIGPEERDAPDSGSILSVRPSGNGLHVLHRATGTLRFFKPVWSPDGRQILTGCFDTRAGIDRLCTISTNNRVSVVIAGDTPVNFPSWGSHPADLPTKISALLIAKYRSGDYTVAELADLFNVARSAVERAIDRAEASAVSGLLPRSDSEPIG